MVDYISDYIKNSNSIIIVVGILIILFVIKSVALGIYINYEHKLSKEITGFKDIVEEKFTDIIDIELMKSAFVNDKYDEKFTESTIDNDNAIFTKELILELIKKNGKDKTTKIITDYTKDTNNKEALDKLITRYHEVSPEIDNNLLNNYSDNVIVSIDEKRKEIDNKFFEVFSFLKKQKYPINVVIDTGILILIIIVCISYILYYKIHSLLLLITFVVSAIMLIFYQSNTLILIMAFSGFYVAYFFKLYQIIKSNKQQ